MWHDDRHQKCFLLFLVFWRFYTYYPKYFWVISRKVECIRWVPDLHVCLAAAALSPKHCLKRVTLFCSFMKPQQCNFAPILQIFLKDSLGGKSAEHMFNNSTNRQQLLQITLSERIPQQCIANFNNVLELLIARAAARYSFLRHSWWRNINLSLFLRLAGVTLPSVGREWQIFHSWWNENAEIQECLWDFAGHLWPAQGQGPLPRWRSTGWSCSSCRLPQIHTILNNIGIMKLFPHTHAHTWGYCVCFASF